MFKVSVDMDPVPKGRPRMTRGGHVYTPAKTSRAESIVASAASAAMGKKQPMEGALKALFVFTFKRPKSNKTVNHTQRPDLDNCVKLVTDAINGIVYVDDSQIVQFESIKQWGDSGNISIKIIPY